jgi:hypothetical protein
MMTNSKPAARSAWGANPRRTTFCRFADQSKTLNMAKSQVVAITSALQATNPPLFEKLLKKTPTKPPQQPTQGR